MNINAVHEIARVVRLAIGIAIIICLVRQDKATTFLVEFGVALLLLNSVKD